MRNLIVAAVFLFPTVRIFAAEPAKDAPPAAEPKQELTYPDNPAFQIAEVKAAYDDYRKVKTAAKTKYMTGLEKEKAAVQAKGDLDGIKAVQAEIELIKKEETDASDADFKDKKALAGIQKIYNAEIEKGKKAYLAKLEEVQKSMVKAGKLAEAEKVKTIIDDLKLDDIKKLFCGTWKYDNGVVQTYNFDGTVESKGVKGGAWSVKGTKIEIAWTSGFIDSFQLPLDGKTLSMVNNKGGKAKAVRVQ